MGYDSLNKIVIEKHTREINHYLKRLFPISRSITGFGNRKTLEILQEIIPLKILEYSSGQKIYDWVIPKEWNVQDAWIKNSNGEKIVDFQKNNLHVISYSIPLHENLSFHELKSRLHYREDLPKAIPYRTTYYKEDWGFCVSFDDFQKFFKPQEDYEVYIDSTLSHGSLSIGELLISGKSTKEFLISTYICHPSIANDNLSGTIMTAFLAKELLQKRLNFSYRIIFVPETIGAIAYCAKNENEMKAIESGLVVTNVGGPGRFSYKQSFDSKHFINKLIEQTFQDNGIDFITYPFDIHGSDERQYSSPGFRIQMATICKDKYYEYPFYHTSLDNLDFVKAENIDESLNLYLQVIDKLDYNVGFIRKDIHCEVMLSKYDLYPKLGGAQRPTGNRPNDLDIILWLLFYCDGEQSLFDISEKTDLSLEKLYSIAQKLESKGIIKRLS